MQTKEKFIKVRVTNEEREALKRKAREAGLTVSGYIRRALLHAGGRNTVTIDTAPLLSLRVELHRHGVNLNQLMHFCNAYGLDAFNERQVIPVLRSEQAVFQQVRLAMASIAEEARKQNVIICLETTEDDEEGAGG